MKRLSIILMVMALFAGTAAAEWTFSDVSNILAPARSDARVLAWGDVNNDGVMDLFVGGADGSALYINNKTKLADASLTYNVGWIDKVTSAQFVDYNLDGRIDLLCLVDNAFGFVLLEQTADKAFQPAEIERSKPFTTAVRSAQFFDVDGNGDLDLVLSNGPDGGPLVYAQKETGFHEGALTFISEGLDKVGAMTAIDFDKDGDIDHALGASGAAQPHVFIRSGSEYAEYSGIEMPLGFAPRSMTWFDCNNDNYPDLVAPGATLDLSKLYVSEIRDGKVQFKDMSGLAGMTYGVGAREVHAIDANMDGWTDLYFVSELGNSLLINREGTRFTNVAPSVGISNPLSYNRSCAWADFDGDGDLDLAVTCASGVKLYKNELQTGHPYVALRLVGEDAKSQLQNCQVTVSFAGGTKSASTSNWACGASSDAPILYIADVSEARVTTLSAAVSWPDGSNSYYTAPEVRYDEVCTLVKAVTNPSIFVPEPAPPEGVCMDLTSSPNPFNPTADIRFTLNSSAAVKLSVYNLLGQEVAVLANGPYTAGAHRFTFDASALPTGLYIARIDAGGETMIHRMLLTK